MVFSLAALTVYEQTGVTRRGIVNIRLGVRIGCKGAFFCVIGSWLGIVYSVAVDRDWISGNPCVSLARTSMQAQLAITL